MRPLQGSSPGRPSSTRKTKSDGNSSAVVSSSTLNLFYQVSILVSNAIQWSYKTIFFISWKWSKYLILTTKVVFSWTLAYASVGEENKVVSQTVSCSWSVGTNKLKCNNYLLYIQRRFAKIVVYPLSLRFFGFRPKDLCKITWTLKLISMLSGSLKERQHWNKELKNLNLKKIACNKTNKFQNMFW